MVVEGPEAIRVVREMVGVTNGLKANPGTIRGDFSTSQQMNLVHASDGPEAAVREVDIFFAPDEIHDYSPTLRQWMHAVLIYSQLNNYDANLLTNPSSVVIYYNRGRIPRQPRKLR